MEGFLQILIYLGCALLVLIGIGILQIGLASPKSPKGEVVALGYAAVILALGAAVVFYGMAQDQAAYVAQLG